MKLIVCIKQVPNTVEVKLDPATGRLIRDGVPNIINPDDKNALEEALRIKDENPGTTVTVLSMGPAQADVAMREALAMGADEAILLSDRAFGGSDTWATSYIIATAIKKINDFDIIFCGRQAIDGDTAQVGPQIACELGIPQITYARDIKVEGDKVTVQQENEEGYIVTEANFPVLITAVKDLNEPRFPTIRGTMKAKRREIPNLDAAAVAADDAQIGLSGSPTKVRKIFTPPQRSGGLVLKVEDDNEQAIVDQVMEKLVAQKII